MSPDDIAVAIDFGLLDAFQWVRSTSSNAGRRRRAVSLPRRISYGFTVRDTEEECVAFAGPGEYGGLFISMSTRYEDMDGFRVPKELRWHRYIPAPGIDVAQHYLLGSVQQFDRVMQLTTNASTGLLTETLLQEIQPMNFFRQTDYTPPLLPRNGRLVDRRAMEATVNALFALPTEEAHRFQSCHRPLLFGA